MHSLAGFLHTSKLGATPDRHAPSQQDLGKPTLRLSMVILGSVQLTVKLTITTTFDPLWLFRFSQAQTHTGRPSPGSHIFRSRACSEAKHSSHTEA